MAEQAWRGKQAIPKAERGKLRGGRGRFPGNMWHGDGRDGARDATLVPCSIATMGQEHEVLMELAEAAASRGAWERDVLVRWIKTGAVACEAARLDLGRTRASKIPFMRCAGMLVSSKPSKKLGCCPLRTRY
jgi:hypothetical protein